MAVILITGSSSGFGMLAASRLAAGGNKVYASMRNLDKATDLNDELAARSTMAVSLQLDVTDNASIAAAIARIEQDEGKLDVLINNAGYGLGGYFEDLTDSEIRAQFDTNYFGAMAVTRAALPLMRKTAETAAGVKIINISSIQGRMAVPGLSSYSASKFALEAFSEALYYELLPFNVSVVLIEPGSYHTKIFSENAVVAKGYENELSVYRSFSQKMRQRIEKMTDDPKAMGNPEDVAKLIEQIAKKPRPRLRYAVGGRAKKLILLQKLLPGRWFQAMVARGTSHFASKERAD